jgi:hypothetical protein
MFSSPSPPSSEDESDPPPVLVRTKPPATTTKRPCRYGAQCYQTNPQHLARFSHDVPVATTTTTQATDSTNASQNQSTLKRKLPDCFGDADGTDTQAKRQRTTTTATTTITNKYTDDIYDDNDGNASVDISQDQQASSTSDQQSTATAVEGTRPKSTKPICPYLRVCQRKGKAHLAKFSHGSDDESVREEYAKGIKDTRSVSPPPFVHQKPKPIKLRGANVDQYSNDDQDGQDERHSKRRTIARPAVVSKILNTVVSTESHDISDGQDEDNQDNEHDDDDDDGEDERGPEPKPNRAMEEGESIDVPGSGTAKYLVKRVANHYYCTYVLASTTHMPLVLVLIACTCDGMQMHGLATTTKGSR